MRTVLYISGTRADFGLMEKTLLTLQADPRLSVSVLVTGMHLDHAYGSTVDAVRGSGVCIAGEVPTPLTPANGARMARNIGLMTSAFVDHMERLRPDLVLLLGDRGEMLAGAIAAIHLNIPVAHIHGGERSGTVDEPVRHAVSKLAHLHLVATDGARERLVRMGEAPEHVHVTGAPGLDGLMDGARPTKLDLMRRYGLDPAHPFALLVYHPVLQDSDRAAADTAAILEGLHAAGCAVLALAPNADAGSEGVRSVLEAAPATSVFALRTHLDRPEFIAAMASADVMVGNSSAGIIEAASFGTPVLNVGSRQNLRERNLNVTDTSATAIEVQDKVELLLEHGRLPAENVYGDGQAAARIVGLLATVDLDGSMLMKVNRY